MKASKFKFYSLLGQIGFWSILVLIHFMEEIDYSSLGISIFYAFSQVAGIATITYIHYYLLIPLLNRDKPRLYALSTLGLISANCVLNFWVLVHFPFDYETDYGQEFWGTFIYDFLLSSVIVGSSSMYYFVEVWIKNQQVESQLKNEKLQTELNFLKSQINPHFLFNTLNNIYSYAQTNNPKTAPMLERLSSILRFMVYDCSEDIVALNKEVKAVENLLEIQKMKNSTQQNICLTTTGIKGFHLIAPLIIVNFVENACKHSDTISNPKGFINIKIEVDENDHCQL
ncbi:MAG: histidine kinase, partial [Bacteroidota bacterium]